MKRRDFLKVAGTSAVGMSGFAGCLNVGSGGSQSDLLRVATQPAFVDATSSSPGGWLKKEFESRFDATLKWFVPDGELNYFIQRRDAGVTIDTDMYVGLTAANMVKSDAKLGDKQLFKKTDKSNLDNVDAVIDDYRFDPKDRVIPTGASYVSLVYDENEIDAPATFDDLTKPEYEGAVLLANPQTTDTGLSFLLWTIHNYGEDGYLDYWRKLMDNNVRILGTWNDAYTAYQNGEAPIVVSYSTDQVYANRFDQDMSRHQIGFLNDQGYAYVSGMTKFASTEKDDLAETFMDFMLEPDVQAKVAVKNVGLPTVDNADLPDDFDKFAHVPENQVSYGYEELSGKMGGWRDAWAKQIAGK